MKRHTRPAGKWRPKTLFFVFALSIFSSSFFYAHTVNAGAFEPFNELISVIRPGFLVGQALPPPLPPPSTGDADCNQPSGRLLGCSCETDAHCKTGLTCVNGACGSGGTTDVPGGGTPGDGSTPPAGGTYRCACYDPSVSNKAIGPTYESASGDCEALSACTNSCARDCALCAPDGGVDCSGSLPAAPGVPGAPGTPPGTRARDTEGSGGNLVPCSGPDCDLCKLYVLVRRVINYALFAFALPAAVIALLIGGILLLISAGGDKVKQGHAAISNAVLGLLLAFGAWLVINTILQTIFFQVPFPVGGPLKWFEIPQCQQRIVSAGPPPGAGKAFCLKDGQVDCSGNADKATCEKEGGAFTTQTPTPCVKGYCTQADGKSDCNPSVMRKDCEATPGAVFSLERPQQCGIFGTCTVAPDGNPCSPSELQKYCGFGGQLTQASQICYRESAGGQVTIPCGAAIDKTPSGEPLCFGLFQIHLVNTINGVDCSKALKKTGDPSHPWDIADPTLYNQCKTMAQDQKINVETACQIHQRVGWSSTASWQNSARACNIP